MTELEQREIFAKNFRNYVDCSGKTQREIAKDLGYSYTTVNTWYRGAAMPNAAKIQTLADYFNVGKSALLDDRDNQDSAADYFFNEDARELAQFLRENPEYKALFDASRKVRKEDIAFIKDMIDRASR
jgi:transcriptional regulator with XRE-family HTH domain